MVAIILATFFTPAFSAPIYVCSDLESGVLKMNTIKNAVDIGNIIVSGVQGIKQMF